VGDWTIEVHLENLETGARQTLTPEGVAPNEMILALVRVDARFVYEGVSYFGGKPYADPIARKLIYHCEGYPYP
jgi:hypothetical protein